MSQSYRNQNTNVYHNAENFDDLEYYDSNAPSGLDPGVGYYEMGYQQYPDSSHGQYFYGQSDTNNRYAGFYFTGHEQQSYLALDPTLESQPVISEQGSSSDALRGQCSTSRPTETYVARARAHAHAGQEVLESAPQPVQQTRRRSRRRSTGQTRKVAKPAEFYHPELPTTVADKPWIRTNCATVGKSTRTGKINNWKAEDVYENLKNPQANWRSSHYEFTYDKHGELSKEVYSTKQMKEFIYEHPRSEDCELTIWIQKSPADSARRYPSEHSSRCRFRDCPMGIAFKVNTIRHGHYRVAFDEKWFKYGDEADPFIVAGYAHLYCMERFLDFAEICRKFNVRLDTRVLINEPKQHFAPSLADCVESRIAADFLKSCKDERMFQEWSSYPIHSQFRDGEQKPYDRTLCYQMNVRKNASRPRAQAAILTNRSKGSANILTNQGDLEIIIAARLDKRANNQNKKHKARQNRNDDDSEGDEANLESYSPPAQAPAPLSPQAVRRSTRKRARIAYQGLDNGYEDSGSEDAYRPQESYHYSPAQPSYTRKSSLKRPADLALSGSLTTKRTRFNEPTISNYHDESHAINPYTSASGATFDLPSPQLPITTGRRRSQRLANRAMQSPSHFQDTEPFYGASQVQFMTGPHHVSPITMAPAPSPVPATRRRTRSQGEPNFPHEVLKGTNPEPAISGSALTSPSTAAAATHRYNTRSSSHVSPRGSIAKPRSRNNSTRSVRRLSTMSNGQFSQAFLDSLTNGGDYDFGILDNITLDIPDFMFDGTFPNIGEGDYLV